MRSLVTSLVGAAPAGAVTFGSAASGPLVGVVAVVDAPAFASVLSPVFSLPTPIVLLLEPLEPQPARRIARAATRRASAARGRMALRAFELITAAQPTGR